MTRTIYLVDETTKVHPPSEFLTSLANTLTSQAHTFNTDHEIIRDVKVVHATPPSSASIVMHFMDDSADVPGALGWHDRQGMVPDAFILCKTVLDNGGSWQEGANSVSVCASHETCELLLDLMCNEFVYDESRRLWAKEACDAVEDFSYVLNGQAVSDYVLPAYFIPGGTGKFDKMAKLTKPFSIAKGGYSIVMNASAESQLYGTVDDPNGTMSIALNDYPAWKSELKGLPTSRTMQRLEVGQ